MEMVSGLVLCTVLLVANANYVIRLNGTVNLPMARTESCLPRNCSPQQAAPQPATPEYIGALFHYEKQKMDLKWCKNETYESSYGNIRGSQTECDKNTDGTFSCTPQPMGFCYAFVKLGFHAAPNSRGRAVVSNVGGKPFRGGPDTIQITSLGRRDNTVDFSIQCSNGEPCLEDRLAIMNILFRCD